MIAQRLEPENSKPIVQSQQPETLKPQPLEWHDLPDMARGAMQAIRANRRVQLRDLCSKPVPVAQIATMLEAARYAPNPCGPNLSGPIPSNRAPWRFVVYAGEARLALGRAFAEAYAMSVPRDRFVQVQYEVQYARVWRAPVWIAVAFNPESPTRSGPSETERLEWTTRAIHNAQLAASGLGLASRLSTCLSATHPFVAGFVGLEDHEILLGFLYVGQAERDAPTLEVSQDVRWNLEPEAG